MTDIENFVVDSVYRKLAAAHPGISVHSEHLNIPPAFPCVMIYESSNVTYERTWDELGEHHAAIRFTVEIYTNDLNGKKRAAKQILEEVDAAMLGMGFIRSMKQYSFGTNESSLFAVTAGYQGIAGESYSGHENEIVIYRR